MTVPNDSPIPAERSSKRLTFPRQRRLRSGLDFQRIYALKHKASDARLVLFAARNETGMTRIGLSVSRRHGNSVIRHRLRRLLREAYRLEQFEVPEGLDLILIPGRESNCSTLTDFRNSIVTLCRKLNNRLPSQSVENLRRS